MCSNASRLFATTPARPNLYGHTTGRVWGGGGRIPSVCRVERRLGPSWTREADPSLCGPLARRSPDAARGPPFFPASLRLLQPHAVLNLLRYRLKCWPFCCFFRLGHCVSRCSAVLVLMWVPLCVHITACLWNRRNNGCRCVDAVLITQHYLHVVHIQSLPPVCVVWEERASVFSGVDGDCILPTFTYSGRGWYRYCTK